MQSYQRQYQTQSSLRFVKLYYLKELEHTVGTDSSNLAAKKDFIALKPDVDKLYINKLGNVPTSLNNFKTKVDDLNVGKLKTSVALKKLNDVVANKVKNTKFNQK